MKNHKRKVLFIVTFISLLGWSDRILFRTFSKKLKRILKHRAGIYFSIHNVSFKSLSKLKFSLIYIKTKKIRLILKDGVLSLDLRCFLRLKSISKIIKEFELNDVFIQIDLASNLKGKSHKPFDKPYFSFENYYSLFSRMFTLFWDFDNIGKIKQFKGSVGLYGRKIIFLGKNCIISSVEIEVFDLLTLIASANDKRQLFKVAGSKMTFRLSVSCTYRLTGDIRGIKFTNSNISPITKEIQNIQLDFNFKFDQNEFHLQKDSAIEIDGISAALEIYYNAVEKDLIKSSLVLLVEGEHFFREFPFLSIKELKDLKGTGDIIIRLDYMTSLLDLTQYYFESKVIKNTFSLNETSRTDLFKFFTGNLKKEKQKINNNHVSEVWVPIYKMPSELISTILNTEDPNFLTHNGVDTYFIGLAIAKNILARKFQLGGSTITMQLARNIFLSHDKNIERKLEEIVLALLIENSSITKNSILEHYLNIIEFGKEIYGISNAVNFYFGKDVNSLNFTECLVLSYIIPRPKYFLEALLMKSPQLIKNLLHHVEFYSNILLMKKHITEECVQNIDFNLDFANSIGTLRLK